MKTERQISIEKLNEAIQNKSLSCYKENVNHCFYYHRDSDSCCAIGVLVPKEQLFSNLDFDGDCNSFIKEADGPIGDHLFVIGADSMFGLNSHELINLQRLHDDCISNKKHKDSYIRRLENFVRGLV